ncbi:MAG: NupC/NupG family nucleoside CNT transporter [Sandaracinaceae bacterium]
MTRLRSVLGLGILVAALIGGVGSALAQDGGRTPRTEEASDRAAEPEAARPAPETLGALRGAPTPWTERARSGAGLFVMLLLAWALSTKRKEVRWPLVAWGLGLQLLFGLLVLKTALGQAVFGVLNEGVVQLLAFTEAGTRFLVGDVLDREFTVALNVLPIIVFFSSLMALAYHLRVVQPVVRAIAWVMQRTLGTSGAETLSAAANIFVGQTEAPLVVRPFVAGMTRSELMALMTGGFATVAGSVLGAYVGMLRPYFPDIGGHLIAASVMSAPAALVIAKVMVPETGDPETAGALELRLDDPYANVIDAAAGGAADGMKLAVNVAAMLLAFLALVAMLNFLLGLVTAPWTGTPWTLEGILGVLFWPLAWAMGVPTGDCGAVGRLLGEKIVVTEFVAYVHLAETLGEEGALSSRGALIATYALCGFANFGSIAVQLGGIGGIAPERRADLARLGLRAMVGGSLAAFMTACVAGLLL